MTLCESLAAFTAHLHRQALRKHFRWQVRGFANANTGAR